MKLLKKGQGLVEYNIITVLLLALAYFVAWLFGITLEQAIAWVIAAFGLGG